jgi:hypothetical protein
MSNPTLLTQLLNRVALFQRNYPAITQAQIAKSCNISESNFSAALAGKRGLSANSVLKLHKLLSLPSNQVMVKFHSPARSSQITHFQTLGKSMQHDSSGWYPSKDGSGGVDPNDDSGNGIDNAPDADPTGPVWDQSLIDTLRTARGYHRKAVRAINAYINQAKVNAGITTTTGVSQKFMRFPSMPDDVRDSQSVRDLITVIAGLKDSVRRQVVALILDKFPNLR